FDQFAGNYKSVLDQSIALSGEDSSYFAEYKALYLARIVGSSFSGKILDFGCGVGLLSGFLKKHLPAARLNGFDVSGESIARISPSLNASGAFTSEESQLAHDYDLIVTANVLHHVPPEHRSKTIADLAERLSPRGRLAIIEHNPANPLTRRAVDRCPFDEDAVLLPPGETKTLIRDAGLNIVRRDYIVFMPHALSWLRPLEPALAWVPLGAQYAVLGQKHA
ncbi:MAG TPA: class I SAM-dependent methyltransferase, partial [Terriglobales bacterium]|nr:class I SAM-dependent methyltransferase [Terriglobales bacterium]